MFWLWHWGHGLRLDAGPEESLLWSAKLLPDRADPGLAGPVAARIGLAPFGTPCCAPYREVLLERAQADAECRRLDRDDQAEMLAIQRFLGAAPRVPRRNSAH